MTVVSEGPIGDLLNGIQTLVDNQNRADDTILVQVRER